MTDEQTIEITYGHYFELLDRTHIAHENLQRNIGEHPSLIVHPELKATYEQAEKALAELYQQVNEAMSQR